MSKDYLAMFLQVRFDLGKPDIFIPIMHFAESPSVMRTDIQQNLLIKTREDAERKKAILVSLQQFHVTALIFSDNKENKSILRPSRKEALKKMLAEINKLVHPTSPVIGRPEVPTADIIYGMRNSHTPYTKEFIDRNNFSDKKGVRIFIRGPVFKFEEFLINNVPRSIISFGGSSGVFLMSVD